MYVYAGLANQAIHDSAAELEKNEHTCMMQYSTTLNSTLPVLSSAHRCANSLGKPLQQIWINTQKIARRLPHLLNEINIDFGTSDKIFSSQWLSETEILIGSKCNKVATVTIYSNTLII